MSDAAPSYIDGVRIRGEQLAMALGALVAFGTGIALVAVRGHVAPSTVALALALVVAVAARYGARPGGLGAAVTAALIFDFVHTKPYLSLKISSTDDTVTTVALLLVGLVVGGLAAEAGRAQERAVNGRTDAASLARVLGVAGSTLVEDVEMVVRAELLDMLALDDCRFTTDDVPLPELDRSGALPGGVFRFVDDGFELPRSGIAIPVEARGERFGTIACSPVAGRGIAVEQRRSAAALAHVLGLAIAAHTRTD